jgi:nitrous oxidase accessory protein NosD
MSGDYSRQRFDPKNDFSGVLMQQGRVQLDADWNELVEILDRRRRAKTTDIIGRCVVPKETPDGFKIEASGGTFTIGRGRIYVDGLLAENHGAGAPEFDRVLGELRGKDPVLYDKQPYYNKDIHQVEPLPQGGPHLVYIDVWERELTHLEDPNLIEKAVGVDTTTRLQTVWQVKVHTLPTGSNVTCSTPDDQIQGWLDIIQPSAGRLSTGTVTIPSDEDPCILPPTGGYRGLENQLYRVEIHDGGPIGTATFKWSRDNASVATNVTAIPALDQLIVESTGRDQVLRFNIGDWVEITDDWCEFAGESGIIRRVKYVNDATRSITLEANLPAGIFPTDAQNKTYPSRHTRIRRWDQKGEVRDTNGNLIIDLDAPGSTGVIPVPAEGVSIILEHGIQITFHTEPAGGKFRIGDYWVFAARAADASVEELEKAPPVGIHHHYGRLAIVTFPNVEDDCRIFWPPECEKGVGCCTAVVNPGEDIQAALDALPENGGCVCLKTGTHIINEPIRIEKSNVILHGESPGTMIERTNGVNMLTIGKQVSNIRVEGIRFLTTIKQGVTDQDVPAIVFINNCQEVSVRDCDIEAESKDPEQIIGGIYAAYSGRITIKENLINNVYVGITGNNSKILDVSENTITGPVKRGLGGVMTWGDVVGPCHIEKNHIKNYWCGVAMGETAKRSVIAGNEILGPALVGIWTTAAHSRVEGNHIWNQFFFGIVVSPLQAQSHQRPDHSLIKNNTLTTGIQGAIVVIGAEGVQVLGNHIESAQEAKTGLAIILVITKQSLVASNRIRSAEGGVLIGNSEQGVALGYGRGNRVIGNHLSDGGSGIFAILESDLEIAQNVVENMKAYGIAGYQILSNITISHNRVAWCGYENLDPLGIAILGIANYIAKDLTIESCEVLDTGISRDGETLFKDATFGIWVREVQNCRIHGNRVVGTNKVAKDKGHRAIYLMGLPLSPGNVELLGNTAIGMGIEHLVELAYYYYDTTIGRLLIPTFGKVLFSNNHCRHIQVQPLDQQPLRSTVLLAGYHLSVVGNQIGADKENFPSFNFAASTYLTSVGNVTSGLWVNIPGQVKPAPYNNFNHIGV